MKSIPVSLSESTPNPWYSRDLLSPFFLLPIPDFDFVGWIQNVPILIPVQESRKDSVQVCAGADEEQDHEEEGLELEDAELF